MHEYIEGLYFYTATCLEWKPLLLEERHQRIILDGLTYFTDANVCNMYGFVIMPNHIHLLLSVRNSDLKMFQHSFMKYTAQRILNDMRSEKSPLLVELESTQEDRNYHFWERRPKWKSIITSSVFYQKLRYIHNNPLQAQWKLCNAAEDYNMSSASSYEKGISEYGFLTLYG